MRERLRRFISRLVWPDAVPHGDARTVLAHEWLTALGGSDKVAARLADIIDADVVYVFALDRDLVERLGFDVPVVTWRFGAAMAHFGRFHLLLAIMPIVWRALDLSGSGFVMTSSHACVNAIRTPSAPRVSYVHTPMRYAWFWRMEQGRMPGGLRWAMPFAAAVLRRLDRRWSRDVDVFIANSAVVQERIASSYDRTSTVIAPPIDTVYWTPGERAPRDGNTSFVVAGRLVAYKEPAVAVEAANLAGVDLVVAGGGPELASLRAIAGETVRFVEQPSDDELRDLLRSADALVFPGIEDFGMLPVEAQACGAAVVARGAGGALETVHDGVTGTFVEGIDPVTWAAALSAFDRRRFDRADARRHAETFGVERFDRSIAAVVDDVRSRPRAR